MEFLNRECTAELWSEIQAAFQQKQDKLVGMQNQLVGFDAAGNISAYTAAAPGGVATLGPDGVLNKAQRPALAGIQGGSNPNLLDNWYFPTPINQRGQTEYSSTGNTYFIDRWAFYQSGGKYYTGTRQLAMSNTDLNGIFQRYENPQRLIGKAVTFSFLYSADIPTVIQIAGIVNGKSQVIARQHIPAHDAEELYAVTGIIPEGIDELNLQLFNTPSKSEAQSGTATLLAAKLELGSVQSLAYKDGDIWVLNDSVPNIVLELVKCQRYQLTLQDFPGNYGGAVGYGFCANIDNVRICVPTPVTMRSNPVLTYLTGNISTAPLTVYDSTGGHVVLLPERVQGNYQNQVYILFRAPNKDLAPNQPCVFRISGAGILLLDANL